MAAALGVVRHLELDARPVAHSAGPRSPREHRRAEGSRRSIRAAIPVTYVPARNTIFLSLALGWAEVLGAADIFIGVNALDYSGYPDCRPEFIEAFERLARAGDASRRRRPAADDPHAAHHHVEGGDHRARAVARPRLRADPQLLRPAARRPPLRALRQLPAARRGLCGGWRNRPLDWPPPADTIRPEPPALAQPLRRQIVFLAVLLTLVVYAAIFYAARLT